jgi:hypothetical protein
MPKYITQNPHRPLSQSVLPLPIANAKFMANAALGC